MKYLKIYQVFQPFGTKLQSKLGFSFLPKHLQQNIVDRHKSTQNIFTLTNDTLYFGQFTSLGPSTYDIRFFGPFFTYPPTHIRSYPKLEKVPKVGYPIFENRPTQMHNMYLIFLSIIWVFG